MSTWVCANCGGENPAGMKFCGHCGRPAEQDVTEALRSFVAGPVADKLVEAGGTLPEERRLITALFADVSGFTSLADRLDPEELLEVIDPVISGLSSVVGRYGGYVEKFAGDALMALFGAPVSHEDDAARALRVALEMHSELARLVEELPHDAKLTLHVGVNSGHGIARILGSEARMDYAVLGDSVILAQRLESAAPPGETYVSDATVQLTNSQFEFEPVGLLELKGKSERVSAWKLLGLRTEARRTAVARVVGRETELAQIASYLDAPRGVLTITGEPGLGKSRLVDAARSEAGTRALQWLETRCLSYGAELPYWPFAELLRTVSNRPSDPHFDRLLGGDELATLEPEAFRRGLYDAFVGWLAQAQTIVAIEDLHWADASTLALTGVLARSGVNLLLTARPEVDLSEIPGERIDLAPLGRYSTAAIAAATLGGEPDAELETLLVERTGGNPFFVQELSRALRESGRIAAHNESWQLAGEVQADDVPPTIEGVLAARIDLLGRAAAEALGTAAVIGRRIPLELLRAVSPALPPDALPELTQAGLLDQVDDDAVSFHHALVQDVAYGRLLRRRRRELHLRVAEIAESLYGAGDDAIGLLARHLYLGDAGDKAVTYLVRAGERAKQLFANDEAILHLRRAAELEPDDVNIALSLADLEELVGNYDEALSLYSSARDRTGDVMAWRGLAATYRKRGEYLSALAAIDGAFSSEDLKDADLTSLWLEAGWTLVLSSYLDQAIDVLNAGIEAASERPTPALPHLFTHLARAEILEDRTNEALDHALHAQALFEEAGDLRGLASAVRVTGDAYRVLGRLEESTASLRHGLALAERVGSIEEMGGCLINLGVAELEGSAHEEAIRCYERAIELFERIGHASGRTIGYSNLAYALTQAGRYSEALTACERARELAREIGHPLTLAETTDTMAVADFRQGHYASAAERAEEAAGLFVDLGAFRRAVESFELAADAWTRADAVERARDARERARSLAASAV
jgi:class 3 adenylate cyclase/tetratricopeptide (TPR) repeat protein